MVAARRILLASALVLALPASAGAAYVSSVSVYSTPDDPVGYGQQYVLHPGNARDLSAHPERGSIVVSADRVEGPSVNPIRPGGFSFTFAAAPGQALAPAAYVGARRFPFNDEGGFPGMDIDGVRGCNELLARFEVKDLEIREDVVTRLWVIYHLHCSPGGPQPATFGEIRIGAWVPRTARWMAPGIVRWPPHDAWQTATPVPVTYLNKAPIRAVAVVGRHPGDFGVDGGACVGRGGPCDMTVRFTPAAAGAREATLRVTDTRGRVHETQLEAFVHGGTTRADVEVRPAGSTNAPGRRVFTPADSIFAGRFFPAQVELYVRRNDEEGSWLDASFGGGGATPVAPGHYPNATGDLAPEPWLNVIGRDINCRSSGGEFTVHSMSLLPEGLLRTFDVEFRQNCGREAGLLGRWQFRAQSNEPLAPWMVPGPRPRVVVPRSARRSILAVRCPGPIARAAARRRGTTRADRIRGGPGSDFVLAGAGADRVDGRRGADCVGGGPGDDRIAGGLGDDHLLGQTGDDVLVGGEGADHLSCGPGDNDVALIGPGDFVGGCEEVRRVAR